MRAELTHKAQREVEELWHVRKRATELLDLVVAEWNSDPMSVQCFDLRIVEEAKVVITRLKKLEQSCFGY